MRYKLPRWVGVATLLITAMKLGIPAFAQEFEPGDQSIDPSVEVIETIDPSVEEVGEIVDETVVVDPGIEVVDPGVEVVDPGIEVVDPGIEVVDPSGEGTGTGDECVNGPPGLYAADCTTLAQGVEAYAPAYELWSDGAAKSRFIYLPPVDEANPDGPKQPIDATDPDRWIFPPKRDSTKPS